MVEARHSARINPADTKGDAFTGELYRAEGIHSDVQAGNLAWSVAESFRRTACALRGDTVGKQPHRSIMNGPGRGRKRARCGTTGRATSFLQEYSGISPLGPHVRRACVRGRSAGVEL